MLVQSYSVLTEHVMFVHSYPVLAEHIMYIGSYPVHAHHVITVKVVQCQKYLSTHCTVTWCYSYKAKTDITLLANTF